MQINIEICPDSTTFLVVTERLSSTWYHHPSIHECFSTAEPPYLSLSTCPNAIVCLLVTTHPGRLEFALATILCRFDRVHHACPSPTRFFNQSFAAFCLQPRSPLKVCNSDSFGSSRKVPFQRLQRVSTVDIVKHWSQKCCCRLLSRMNNS